MCQQGINVVKNDNISEERLKPRPRLIKQDHRLQGFQKRKSLGAHAGCSQSSKCGKPCAFEVAVRTKWYVLLLALQATDVLASLVVSLQANGKDVYVSR